jgi:hypothetical protein
MRDGVTSLTLRRLATQGPEGCTSRRVIDLTAAWGCGGRVEGLFRSGLHASMLEGVGYGVFGTEPFSETQRFWPARPALASAMVSGTDRLCMAAKVHGCTAVTRAWTVVSKGQVSGSRGWLLL